MLRKILMNLDGNKFDKLKKKLLKSSENNKL